MRHPARLCVLVVWLLALPAFAQAQTVPELDRYWAEISRTVQQGDFSGYSRLYHPDAVVVDLRSRSTKSIAKALAGWEEGIRATAEGKSAASVAFRFTRRLHDATTAHETGIFRYANTPRGGAETVAFVHFESLLVRKDGAWVTLMEYQKEPATAEAWEAAGR